MVHPKKSGGSPLPFDIRGSLLLSGGAWVPRAPQNSGSPPPPNPGVPFLYGAPPPTRGSRVRTPKFGLPPPPLSLMGCPKTRGSPPPPHPRGLRGGPVCTPKLRDPPSLFLGCPGPRRTPKIGGPSRAPRNSGVSGVVYGVPGEPHNSGTPPQFMGSPPVRPTSPGPPPQFHDPSPIYGVPLCAPHNSGTPPNNSGTPPQFMGSLCAPYNSRTPPQFMGSPCAPHSSGTPSPPPEQLRDPSPLYGVPPCAPYNSGTPPLTPTTP